MIKGAGKGALEGAQDGMISGMISGAFSGAAASMMGNPMFCFVAGTTVLTTLGKKAIETIKVGDTIPCVDHITGESAEKRVITTTVNKVNRLIELDIDGEIIKCTETHPFQVKGKGWVNASDLAPNDIVYTKDWNTATVKSVSLLELDEPVEVFNFEVEDCHTYFVGEQCVLVHNACLNKQGPSNSTINSNNSYSVRPSSVANGKITGYTKHGLESAMGHDNHGIQPRAILDIVKNPSKVIDQGVRETTKYVSQKGVVVLNRAGEIVTTYAKSSKFWRM